MRQILFRGKGNKKFNDGSWFYGGVCQNKYGDYQICAGSWFATVVSATLGQYTGVNDSNGAKIFEGDIVEGKALSHVWRGVIVWIGNVAGFGIRYIDSDSPIPWKESTILRQLEPGRTSALAAKVIGNIHDNPELMQI